MKLCHFDPTHSSTNGKFVNWNVCPHFTFTQVSRNGGVVVYGENTRPLRWYHTEYNLDTNNGYKGLTIIPFIIINCFQSNYHITWQRRCHYYRLIIYFGRGLIASMFQLVRARGHGMRPPRIIFGAMMGQRLMFAVQKQRLLFCYRRQKHKPFSHSLSHQGGGCFGSHHESYLLFNAALNRHIQNTLLYFTDHNFE